MTYPYLVKTKEQIDGIKQACFIWKEVKKAILNYVKEGITLIQIDNFANDQILKHNAIPTFYNKYGFKGHICISVNCCVIHGVPSPYALKNGDLVSIDMGVTYNGYICDAAFSFIIGSNDEAIKIINATNSVFDVLKKYIKPGVTNQDIAKLIQETIHSNGYKILHDFSGHGCGLELHEDPMFANYYPNGFEEVSLVPGMVFCIEPMVMTKSNQYFIDPLNNWDVIAKNGLLTCHIENMFVVTEDGNEMITGD